MSGYRLSYTHQEEVKMLEYIIKKKGYYRLRGIAFWKEMAEELELSRTYQSLKEHFRKQVVNKLYSAYFPEIPKEELNKIQIAYNSSSIKNISENEGVDLRVTPPSSDTE